MLKILSLALFSIIPLVCFAEGPPWRKVSAISFAGDKVGIAVEEGDHLHDQRGPSYYEIAPATWQMRSIGQEEYGTIYHKNELSALSGHSVTPIKEFKTTSGKTFHMEYEDCTSAEEGGDQCKKAYVKYAGKQLKLDTRSNCPNSCVVTDLQEWKDVIWISLGHHGEYSMNGHGFQAYDLMTGKKIFEYNLNGGVKVSLIDKDPKTQKVWAMHDDGIIVIGPDFKDIQTFFFYIDFNPLTKKGDLQLSATIKSNNRFAEIARRLNIGNQKDIYEATKTLKSSFDAPSDLFRGYYNGFFPESFNVIVPALLKEKDSEDLKNILCLFKDPRVIARIFKDESCRDKFSKSGLLPKNTDVPYEEGMLEEIRQDIARFTQSDMAGGMRTFMDEAFKKAENLKLAGNNKGLLEFNQFMLGPESDLRHLFLKSMILHRGEKYDELIPSMVHVLKTYKKNFSRACLFFSANRGHGKEREKAEYAVFMLKGIQRLITDYHSSPEATRSAFPAQEIINCSHAFRTQMMVDEIKSKYDKLSSSFTPQEKVLSDYLMKGGIPNNKWKK